MFVSYQLMGLDFPTAAGSWATLPIIAQVALLLVFDDMAQYWWHRASHSVPWLYNLHRAHHCGEDMSVRIVYRNNFFYYLTMPSVWFSGALIYLGLGWVFVSYVVFKQLVIHGAHHGKHKSDGVTNYKGNFGNLQFFWDVLFGTAKITRGYPAEIGVENLPPIPAAEQLAWPLFRSEDARIMLL
jgi:sterol desaturase/sphingolipid hydroxylase (fatty acid hydroxylase superfamily)